jgi:hypothetical protein
LVETSIILLLSDNLKGCGADLMHLLQA